MKVKVLKLLLIPIVFFTLNGSVLAEEITAQYTSKTYMSAVKKQIKHNWSPPKSMASQRVVASFLVLKDGTIEDIEIVQSSQNNEIDDAAIQAVKISSPLPPLPDDYGSSAIYVDFTFDYRTHSILQED